MNYRHALMVAAVVGVAACAQQAPSDSAAYDLSQYPMCSDTDTDAAAAASVDGCVLTQPPMTHALLARRGESTIDVQVVADGEGIQLIQEPAQGTPLGPTLADLNGDSQPDLLIPLNTGNVNTTWAVHLANADATYTRAGEISGVGWGPSATGLLAVPARSSAASWEVDFYDVEPGGLTLVATVETAIEAADAAPTCKLVGTPVLGAQSFEAAQAQYCGDPAVAGIWTEGPSDASATE